MTVYEKMCSDKVFAASMLSEALYGVDFEDGDYEPHAMEILDSEYRGGKHE